MGWNGVLVKSFMRRMGTNCLFLFFSSGEVLNVLIS